MLGQNQPGPKKKKTNNTGPESAWPSNITDRGGIISPPLLLVHVERYSFCMQEKKTTKTQTMRGKKSYPA